MERGLVRGLTSIPAPSEEVILHSAVQNPPGNLIQFPVHDIRQGLLHYAGMDEPPAMIADIRSAHKVPAQVDRRFEGVDVVWAVGLHESWGKGCQQSINLNKEGTYRTHELSKITPSRSKCLPPSEVGSHVVPKPLTEARSPTPPSLLGLAITQYFLPA
jgi:hypothetical protein